MAQWEIHRSADGRTDREAGRLDRNRASSRHGIDERLRPRVPAREHDQLRRHRLAQGRRSHDHARTAAMSRSQADVDAYDRAARFRNSCTARNEHDFRGFGIDVGCDASRLKRLNDRVLDDAAELER